LIAAVVIGLSTEAALGSLEVRRPWIPGLGVAAVLVAPVPTVAVAFLVFTISRFQSAARASRAVGAEREACFEASELIALGLAGGLSVAAAHQVALTYVAPEARVALGRLVRSMKDRGTRAALIADDGPMSAASQVLATAAVSGAPALPALEGHLEVEAHRRHSERAEAARKLPVRLLLPLTLLVLPGFVLLTVGPTVVGSLTRLNP